MVMVMANLRRGDSTALCDEHNLLREHQAGRWFKRTAP